MKAISLGAIFVSVLIWVPQASSQTVGDLPFSVGEIGMGGVSASVPSDNAMALVSNPAQAGLFSLDKIASLSTYIRPSSSGYAQILSMRSSSGEIGVKLTRYLKTPFETSVGIGYSRSDIKTGGPSQFSALYMNGPYYRLNTLTVGLGLEDVVKVGVGFTYRWGSSTEIGTESAGSFDYGIIAQIPIIQLVEGRSEETMVRQSGLRPFLDCNLALAMRNLGESMKNYFYLIDYLREAVFGLNFETGIETSYNGRPWKLLSVVVAREADEPLLRDEASVSNGVTNYYSVYTGWPTYFNPYKDLILGISDANVGIRSGLQIEAAEFLYVRFGSMNGLDANPVPWYDRSSTFGWGVRLNGFLRLISAGETYTRMTSPVISYIVGHVDLEYDYGRVNYSKNVSQSFYQLSLVIS